MAISKRERKLYLLKTKRDEKLLLACKRLDLLDLSGHDRHLVGLIKSQLIDDWRRPLEQEVKSIVKKYK